MANVLPIEKQVAIINALAEGFGIRQIAGITANPKLPRKHVAVLHIAPNYVRCGCCASGNRSGV